MCLLPFCVTSVYYFSIKYLLNKLPIHTYYCLQVHETWVRIFLGFSVSIATAIKNHRPALDDSRRKKFVKTKTSFLSLWALLYLTFMHGDRFGKNLENRFQRIETDKYVIHNISMIKFNNSVTFHRVNSSCTFLAKLYRNEVLLNWYNALSLDVNMHT